MPSGSQASDTGWGPQAPRRSGQVSRKPRAPTRPKPSLCAEAQATATPPSLQDVGTETDWGDLSQEELEHLGQDLAGWFNELDQMVEAEDDLDPWAREGRGLPLGAQVLAPFALIRAESIAAAVYGWGGDQIAATASFVAQGADGLVEPELIRKVATSRTAAVQLAAFRGDEALDGLVACAPAEATVTWRLPVAIHEIAQAGSGRVVVVCTRVGDHHHPIAEACRSYGLTGLQARLAVEVIRRGAIREAAERLGLSYQTAREALASAMKRVGAQRLPGLVTRLTSLAFGVLPGQPARADYLADIWGLSQRQISIAALVGEGLTRPEAAKLLGVSQAVVKKELENIFAMLQVRSGAELARKIVEARALSWLTEATAGGLGFVDDSVEPLRISVAADGRRVAFSDYGPATGRPVLILHSSMTTRIVSRKLLRALHRAGYRPIAIDRPGFGLTDPVRQNASSGDPFVDAVPDVVQVLDLLKLRAVDVVSRGAAQFLVSLHRAHPHRLQRVVLINPGPPYGLSGRSIGPLGAIKAAFVRNPACIRTLARFLAGQLTYRRLSQMMVQWTRGSGPDQAAVQDPEIVNDFYRSVRMFATGRYSGFVQEQVAIARAGRPAPATDVEAWRVLLGDHDVLYEPQVVFSYWKGLLPGARFERVSDGGRFLAMTHPDLVLEALKADS